MALTNEDLQAIASLMDEKLNPIYSKLEKVDNRLNNLESKQAEIKRELYKMNRKISDTYNLALDAWGQSAEANGLSDNEKATG